ncbi:MAG: hypothetical protein HY356_02170 [Gammaproteobacteria bacterium]|nr:hypothetical protein [Gammaproteobacteria bacterium]
MKFATIISVLIFTIGINFAVIIHHDNVSREIDKRKWAELELKSPVIKQPYQFHYVGQGCRALNIAG